MSRRRTPVLVGRRAELAALDEALAATRNGLGQIVVVKGEAGIGKSRLLEDFVARTDDALCVTGNCVDAATEALAYAPWTELLWWLVREIGADALGAERTELARLLPELGGADVDGGRDLLFEAIVEVLHRCASSRSLIVVVEDIHWIDPASRDVLLYVARNLRRLPILLIATHRPVNDEELQQLIGALLRFGITDLPLGALADVDAADVAALLTGGDAADDDVQAIVRRAEGNPLFVEELAAALGDERVPSTIRHLMLSRFNTLDEPARQLVRTAAVIGDRVPRSWLARASALVAVDAPTATRAAVEAGVLTVDADRHGYSFAHALLREAVIDELLPDELVAFHAAVAQALIDEPVFDRDLDVVAELARHWDAAERPSEALRWTIAAARQADRLYAFDAAFALYERALQWWEVADMPEIAAELTHAELLLDAADAAGEVAALHRAAELATEATAELVASGAALQAFSRAWVHLWAARRSGELRELAGVALAHINEVDAPTRADFLVTLGHYELMDARPEDALARSALTAAAVDEVGDPDLRVRASLLLGWCAESMGEFEQADESLQDAIDIARRYDLRSKLALLLYNRASTLATFSRRDEALLLLDEAEAVITEFGVRRLLVPTQSVRATELALGGQLGDAAKCLDQIEELATEGLARHEYETTRALVDLHAGRYAEVIEVLRDDQPGGRLGDDPARILQRANLQADALAWLGDLPRAAETVDGAIAVLHHRLEPYWLSFLAMTGARIQIDLTLSGQRSDVDLAARERAVDISSLLRDSRERLRSPLPIVEAAHLGVGAELARLDPESARASAHAAAAAFGEISMPYFVTYFEWREAEAIIVSRSRESPTALLSRARRRALEHSYSGLQQLIERTARAEQIRLGSRSHQPEEMLSTRELDVLRLLAEGLSNPEIAESLIIGRRTVRTHVSNILTKLGASSRAEAVSVAHKREIL